MSRQDKLSTADKKYISDEITVQLRELKAQLNREIIEDLELLKISIVEEITNKLRLEIDKKVKASSTQLAQDVDKKIKVATDRVATTNNQLALSSEAKTKELMLTVGQEICDSVYSQVITEINEKVVPQVNNMVQWVNYNMQDGGEVVDSYRRAVHNQSMKLDPNMKLLTDGKNDKRVISPHVHMFFGEDTD